MYVIHTETDLKRYLMLKSVTVKNRNQEELRIKHIINEE